ncbi:MAG: hypothetical protein R8M45_05685 [Ghiorsea sp.]
MKAEIRRRLGFASDGVATQQNNLLINDILQSSQEVLYQDYDFPELRRWVDVEVLQGQQFFDFPVDCEPRHILTLAVSLNNVWVELAKGINILHDTFANSPMYPYRYDTAQMVELFPIPNDVYTIRVEYKANLLPFSQDQHQATLDSRAVLLSALVEAKAHYGHQDVGLYQKQLASLLHNFQSQAHNGNHYNRLGKGKSTYIEPLPRRI